MEELKIQVEGVTCREYMQSVRRMALRPYLWMWVIVCAVVGAIGFFTEDTRPQSYVVPAVILLLLPLVYEFYQRQTYRNLPFGDTRMEYWMDARGWRAEVQGNRAVFTWANTRLRETRDTFLLYTDTRTSNLVPKRCLDAGQMAQIRQWARESR